MRRVTDPEVILALAAHPDVREGAGDVDAEDVRALISNPENVALLDDETGACIVFEHEGGGIYDNHWLCAGRGAARLRALKEMVETLFTTYSARGIYGYISRDNRAARVIARWLGGVFAGPHTDAAGRHLVMYYLPRV